MKGRELLFAKARARQATLDCIERAKEIYPPIKHHLDRVKVTFKQRGKIAAKAHAQHWVEAERWECEIRINLEAYALRPKEMIEDTIPHELAHIVCIIRRVDDGHGPAWVQTCIALGGTGEQYHNMRLTSVRKSKRFLYRNHGGHELHLKQGRHSRLQLGKAYYYSVVRTGEVFVKADYVSEVVLNPATGPIEMESEDE